MQKSLKTFNLIKNLQFFFFYFYNCKLEINGRMVEQVMGFKYLGLNIPSSGNLAKEIKTQAQKAARVAGCLNYHVWRNKYMRTETK